MAGTWKSESVKVVYTWDLDTRWEIDSLNLDVTVLDCQRPHLDCYVSFTLRYSCSNLMLFLKRRLDVSHVVTAATNVW